VPRRLVEEMVAQAVAEVPNECCGLLAGRVGPETPGPPVGAVVRRYPLVNAAASPREYNADSRSLIAAHIDMREGGLERLAIYHSHPTSEAVPSRTDLERNYDPSVVYLIISLRTGQPEVRAWWLLEDAYREAEWDITEE
jgi:proteasome lid subunit RPN8/RPN11